MKSKKKKKYQLGTGKNGVVRHYIESPDETLVESDIAMSKARSKAMDNGWGKGLDLVGNMAVQYGTSMMEDGGEVGGGLFSGDSFKQGSSTMKGAASIINMLPMMAQMFGPGFAMGGKVGEGGIPVEVEGEEVGETPNGQLLDFQGPSHENGGIDINLPEGTEIFSKRIKVKGETMAERKLKREKKTMSLEKLLAKNEGDTVLKNSLKRTKTVNKKEEEEDQRLQEMVSNMKKLASYAYGTGADGVRTKHAYGDPVTDPKKGYQEQLDDVGSDPNDPYGHMSDQDFLALAQNFLQMNPQSKTTTGVENEGAQKTSNGEGLKMPKITGGDAIGLAGTLYSAFAPGKNTEKNRAGDTPNINPYEDFGNDALDRMEEAKGYVGQQRDAALFDLDSTRAGTAKRNRNTARGVNTLRALDTAADANINKAQGDIYTQFSEKMIGLLTSQAGFENQQDAQVMAGEATRDDNDRRDRDNYYSQLAKDISTKGEGIQRVGKMLNENKKNNVSENLINNASENYQIDGQGNILLKNGDKELSAEESREILTQEAEARGMTLEEYQEFLIYKKQKE